MRSHLSSAALSRGARIRKLLSLKPSILPGTGRTLVFPRYFSASSTPTDDFTAKVTNFGGASTDFDNNQGFQAPDQSLFTDSVSFPSEEAVVSAVPVDVPAVDVDVDVSEVAAAVVQELGNHPTHLIIRLIENIHLTAGLPYWETIMVTTIALRFCLFPLAIYTIQNASRMPHAKPKIQKLQEEFQNHPDMMTDPNLQQEFRRKMTQLLQREKVNPIRGIVSPLFQIPIFLSMFFGLKEIGTFLPGMTTGGTLWFTDLTACDSYYIFPVINALGFLLMIEIGMDGLPPNPEMDRFKNVSQVKITEKV